MGSDVIVLLSPPGGQRSRFVHGREDLAIEQFVSEFPVKVFDVSVLPEAATLDEQRLHAQPREPGPDSPGYELHTGAIVEPQPTPFVVYAPAISPEESRDTAVTIPTILRGQRYDALRQNGLVVGHLERVSLGTAHLPQHPTRPTLGAGQRLTPVHDRLPPSRRAQKYPRETSFRIALSSA